MRRWGEMRRWREVEEKLFLKDLREVRYGDWT